MIVVLNSTLEDSVLGSAYTYDGTTEELPENNNAGLEAEFPACLSFLGSSRLGFMFGAGFWNSDVHIPWPFGDRFCFCKVLLGVRAAGSAFLHPALPQFPNTTTDKLKKNTWIQRLNEPSILDQKTIRRFLKLGVAMPDKKDPLNSGSILN